ncbi:leucine-rich repeat-containing protein 27-like isoform X2 [Anneissia japonica]|uniref:leucine-rich repeat-containing protein 27-like isoform X2 n=1 Tax=Anneissia japonica TaxID=1529436 RepID=UPI0014258BCC|nr:leucine-rich repeat-containing protein 27-like isoform X2 [Anneissia japonica]
MTDDNTSGVVSPDTSSHVTSSSLGVAKLEDWEEEVLNIIISSKALGTTTIDLAGKGIAYFPEELLELDKIENLYLEGNKLTELPSTLFERLPKLRWLDLRNNNLKELPPSVGEHRQLKTLLIEGNQISMLPVELGFIQTLTGLNLRKNPLEFPPQEVIDKGVYEILRFLCEISICQQRNQKGSLGELNFENLRIQNAGESSSDSENLVGYSNQERWSHKTRKSLSRQSFQSSMSNLSDVEGPSSATMSLHKPMSYNEYRQKQYQKFKRAGALGISGRDKRRRRRKKRTPPKPTVDSMQAKVNEELRNNQLRTLKLEQSAAEQRLKDTQLLQEWRDETRELQRKHYIRAIRKDKQDDFTDPALKTPYDTDPNYMKIMSKEERIKVEVKNRHEAMMNRMRPETKKRMEAARLDRDRHLLEKIKEHTKKIHERKQLPKGKPHEVMEAAKKDLEMAKTLHLEINSRQKELEYRFKAFTGDVSPAPAYSKRY